jgi:hypothetical protein
MLDVRVGLSYLHTFPAKENAMNIAFKPAKTPPPAPESVTITLSWEEAETLHRIMGALSPDSVRKVGGFGSVPRDLHEKMNEIRRDAQQPELRHVHGELVFRT